MASRTAAVFDERGMMNGAVMSDERAAREVFR
jgi:hypothetical protein